MPTFESGSDPWSDTAIGSSGATTATITINAVWHAWNGQWPAGFQDATTDTVTNTDTSDWIEWNHVWFDSGTQSAATFVFQPRTESIQEQRERAAARAEERKAARERAAKAKLEREAAERRAEELLKSNLSEEQQNDFEKNGWFLIDAASGKKYRIKRAREGNVELLNPDGTRKARYCAHPKIPCPNPDTMLAQKLMLETDEDNFLKVANRWES